MFLQLIHSYCVLLYIGVCLCVLSFLCDANSVLYCIVCVCDYHREYIIYSIVIGLCCVCMYINPFFADWKVWYFIAA